VRLGVAYHGSIGLALLRVIDVSEVQHRRGPTEELPEARG